MGDCSPEKPLLYALQANPISTRLPISISVSSCTQGTGHFVSPLKPTPLAKYADKREMNGHDADQLRCVQTHLLITWIYLGLLRYVAAMPS